VLFSHSSSNVVREGVLAVAAAAAAATVRRCMAVFSNDSSESQAGWQVIEFFFFSCWREHSHFLREQQK
jgi:hypothetical protein